MDIFRKCCKWFPLFLWFFLWNYVRTLGKFNNSFPGIHQWIHANIHVKHMHMIGGWGGVLLNLFEVRRLKQKKISALWPLVSPHYFQELIKDHLGLQTSNCTCISDEAFLINCVSFLVPMLVNLSHFTFFTRDGYCWANFNQIYQCVLK